MEQAKNIEIALIKKIAGTFARHPMQLNGMFEADSEIIALHGMLEPYLVVKTDGIHEEIREGLYKDPYLVGWMAITVSMSDLAATGADPTGMLLSLQVPKSFDEGWMQELQRGINEACAAYGTYILGGDTNFSQQLAITTTGIGFVDNPVFRKEIKGGDLIYSTATLGGGNAYAYTKFFDSSIHAGYKPVARIKESRLIRSFASACIDTSDGVFPALSILAEINDIGLHFFQPLQSLLSDETLQVYGKAGIPAWFFLAGPHGEYELLFSIPRTKQQAFENACFAAGLRPIVLGEATADKQLHFISENLEINCEPADIANLYDLSGGNIQTYFTMLTQKHEEWCTSKKLNHYANTTR
jgi:thiamine-monophosphate kinase